MLTLVAEVLATDLLFDSVLENDRCDLLSSRSLSRNAMSETREEKDMVAIFVLCMYCVVQAVRILIQAVWVKEQREPPSNKQGGRIDRETLQQIHMK